MLRCIATILIPLWRIGRLATTCRLPVLYRQVRKATLVFSRPAFLSRCSDPLYKCRTRYTTILDLAVVRKLLTLVDRRHHDGAGLQDGLG